MRVGCLNSLADFSLLQALLEFPIEVFERVTLSWAKDRGYFDVEVDVTPLIRRDCLIEPVG